MMRRESYLIETYCHAGRIGVLIEISSETDAALMTAQVKELIKDLALHITACHPKDIAELIKQPFIKEPEVSVGLHLAEIAHKLKERLQITRFVRWDVRRDPPKDGDDPPPKGPAVQLRIERTR